MFEVNKIAISRPNVITPLRRQMNAKWMNRKMDKRDNRRRRQRQQWYREWKNSTAQPIPNWLTSCPNYVTWLRDCREKDILFHSEIHIEENVSMQYAVCVCFFSLSIWNLNKFQGRTNTKQQRRRRISKKQKKTQKLMEKNLPAIKFLCTIVWIFISLSQNPLQMDLYIHIVISKRVCCRLAGQLLLIS